VTSEEPLLGEHCPSLELVDRFRVVEGSGHRSRRGEAVAGNLGRRTGAAEKAGKVGCHASVCAEGVYRGA
jgi:hypothetical protein